MLAVMGSLVLASDMVEGIAFLEWEDGELAKINQDQTLLSAIGYKKAKTRKVFVKGFTRLVV